MERDVDGNHLLAKTTVRSNMTIYLGSFHPHLEERFVTEVKRFKTSEPLRPLLVLVPSDLIRRRLKTLLTLEHGLSLISVSILTFHQLALKLCETRHNSPGLNTQSDLFFEEVLRLQIQHWELNHTPLSGIESTEGGGATLWQCLRDLKDGLVDAELVQSALDEGHFGLDVGNKLRELLKIYQQIQVCCNKNDLLSFGDLARLAIPAVPGSHFLNAFDGIFHYGFYDLTQVQIDLFHAVVQYYETTLFFPLIRKNSAWDFSNRFYERHVEGLVSERSQVFELSDESPRNQNHASNLFEHAGLDPRPSSYQHTRIPSIISCYNNWDEVLVSAKEIVRLVSDEGIQFHEIGLVARDPAPYLPHIKTLFQSHAIPMTTPCEEPLLQYPFAANVLLFIRLKQQDYPRAQCIDLFSSPWFKTAQFYDEETASEKSTWDLLTRQAGVTKGHASWQGLAKINSLKSASPVQGAVLLKIFMVLYDDLATLPSISSYSDYSARFQSLLTRYLGMVIPKEPVVPLDHEMRVKQHIIDILSSLSSLDRIHPQVSLKNFTLSFERWLSRATIPIGDPNISGVSVLGTMAARGLSFRFLFLLGLNEGSFPRNIREDPFLSDRHRRVLETVLGYKVGEKMAAYDEERLLFTLMTEAAREGLLITYHRLGNEGSSASPSWLLNQIPGSGPQNELDSRNQSVTNERFIPHSLLDRQHVEPFDRLDLLLPREAAGLFALSHWEADPILELFPDSSSLYQGSLIAFRKLESPGDLTPFDGLCGPISKIRTTIKREGITPTRLEQYARCPFQFFASNMLKLRPIAAPEDQIDLSMSDAGELCHAILKEFYSRLQQARFFEDSPSASPMEILSACCTPLFRQFEKDHRPPYPLVWEEMKQQMTLMLSQVITLDLSELVRSGFRPVAFEVSCRGQLETQWPEMWGRLDRIDFKEETGGVRVVDYKYTLRKQPKAFEKNLALSAIRGERLQAPIYQRLAEVYGDEGDRETDSSPVQSAFYFLASNWFDGPLVVREFPQDGWDGEAGSLLKDTISTLLEGIQEGRFFMMPGDACTYCKVSTACRKNHLPSRRRVEKNENWEAHHLLREKKLPKKPGK